ncbi:hydroxylysine kinase /5-phosphonooxy-L-lysine phospho-lyase [Algoriphagus ratkowskyi]|uniref:Aminotransferase class III-fold pyridoxal phosphate-dependent enzyme n=1 Tax=Algoriphagus ratkowskyi TaxID=57028 RepID=A0A2W7QU05_9BACT|nr:aminotransferase class III-fold pyridoxal phosphate-dependent enzyme [Algoriphagus ratkowskyi]PZX52118.1 hydroxylysine kinase /5-phosphonooxy-L-lysine phospho-lyase [Algoriphagus ratkowskyi]TXD76119.1 aminotransferase class III-fold pyridoxal phosphate-dependent enzyme [Algoriphagus ratkowskyi]
MRELQRLLQEKFEFENPTIEKLIGYFNINYSIEDRVTKYIFKTYRFDQELFDILEAENEALLHLTNLEAGKYPNPIPTIQNETLFLAEIAGHQTICRLLTFLDGRFLGGVDPSPKLYESLGTFLGKLDRSLQSFNSYTLRARKLDWDIQFLHLNKRLIEDIENPQDRSLVQYFFLQFQEHVIPVLPTLRHQVIHADANEWNVLVQNESISGMIDFGDLTYSPLINEVSVALTYICYDKGNPLDWTGDFLKAYHQIIPLESKELEILYYLIAARLCISVCQSAHARKVDPENTYASISEISAWQMLRKWVAISPLGAANSFKKALNKPIAEVPSLQSQLTRRHQSISPLLSISYATPLSVTGAAFQYMYDSAGNAILDAYNNIPHVGHSHPIVVEAAQRQMAKLNTNTRYLYDELAEYAEKLLAKFPASLSKVYFVNSGSAASDLAMRMAFAHTKNHNVLVMEHGYHGNTQISIDISDYKFNNKKGFGQKSNILKAPIPDTYLGKHKVNDGTAGKLYAQEAMQIIHDAGKTVGAFITEPIVGCGGQVPLAEGYLKNLYPAIRAQGGICISDEVQTGFGRMGDFFWGYEAQGVVPDMVILGKPMGNGHPMGAVVCTEEIAESFSKGVEFFSSFGGNPVSCAIGIAVLDVIAEESLQENAKEVGNYYLGLFRELKKKHACIGDVRGSGLFIGVEIVKPGTTEPDTALASHIKNEMRNRNILISTDGPHDSVLKTKPPLCFTKENALTVVENIDMILKG